MGFSRFSNSVTLLVGVKMRKSRWFIGGVREAGRSSRRMSEKYDVINEWEVMARLASDVVWDLPIRGKSGQ